MRSKSENEPQVVLYAKQKLDKYRQDARCHHVAYFTSDAVALILLILTPIFALTKEPLWAALSSSTGLIAGLSAKYQWRENWFICDRTAKRIEKEIMLFDLENSNSTINQGMFDFVEKVHRHELNHMTEWRGLISKDDNINNNEEQSDSDRNNVNEADNKEGKADDGENESDKC